MKMKKLKVPKTFFAFLFAIGMAFSLKQSQTTVGMIDVKGKAANCPSGQVSDECHVAADDRVCTFIYLEIEYEAVKNNVDECAIATVLHRPG